MAKYSKTYENGNIKNELTFRDIVYDFTMISQEDGSMKADKKCFSAQLKEISGIDLDNTGIDIDMIDCGDDDEILEILNWLDMIE